MENDENQFSLFVGIDWGSQWHEVCIVRSDGRLSLRKRVRHTGEGLGELVGWLRSLEEEEGSLAVAIEVPHGPVVETMVDAGFPVFSINPKQSDRFRDRHTVAGAKDDRRDAYVLADALRTDLPKFRRVVTSDPTTVQLREITRWHEELNGDLRRLSNRLRELLQRYFPAVLELCPAADELSLMVSARISSSAELQPGPPAFSAPARSRRRRLAQVEVHATRVESASEFSPPQRSRMPDGT